MYIKEEQTTQWPKENKQKDKQRSTKHTYKTNICQILQLIAGKKGIKFVINCITSLSVWSDKSLKWCPLPQNNFRQLFMRRAITSKTIKAKNV